MYAHGKHFSFQRLVLLSMYLFSGLRALNSSSLWKDAGSHWKSLILIKFGNFVPGQYTAAICRSAANSASFAMLWKGLKILLLVFFLYLKIQLKPAPSEVVLLWTLILICQVLSSKHVAWPDITFLYYWSFRFPYPTVILKVLFCLIYN